MFSPKPPKPQGVIIGKLSGRSVTYLTQDFKLRKLHSYELNNVIKKPCRFYQTPQRSSYKDKFIAFDKFSGDVLISVAKISKHRHRVIKLSDGKLSVCERHNIQIDRAPQQFYIDIYDNDVAS